MIIDRLIMAVALSWAMLIVAILMFGGDISVYGCYWYLVVGMLFAGVIVGGNSD